MDDRLAFHLAICAEPAEDLPRLAFADWLDERGEGHRAEFIRLQCEMYPIAKTCVRPSVFLPTHRCEACGALWAIWDAEGGRETGGWSLLSDVACQVCDVFPMGAPVELLPPEVAKRFVRERELLDIAATEKWVDFPATFSRWKWERGMLAEVDCECAAFMAWAPELAKWPVKVKLTDKEPQLDDAAGIYPATYDWWLQHHDSCQDEFRLPRAIFDCVWELASEASRIEINQHPRDGHRSRWFEFPTAELARDALDAGCLLHLANLRRAMT